MKSCIIKGLIVLACLVVAAGAILWAVKEFSEAVVETIDDAYDVKNYTTFIDDGVRYTLACAHPDYAYIGSNAELESKADRKIEEFSSAYDADQPSYKLALEKLSKEGNSFERNYAAGLLKKYNGLKIELTPFEKDKEKDYKYRFMEKNSRVHFTVSVGILCLCDADSWDLGRYTEYLETGVFKDAPDASYTKENKNDESGEIVEESVESVSELVTLQPIESKPYKSTSNDEVFAYFKEIMGKQFTQKDIQYLESKYSPLIPAESHVSHGEYIDDEDKVIVRPEKKVIIDMLSYHYSVPQYISEYFADADIRNDYYRHLSASRVCYAYELCKTLIDEGRFNTFCKNLKREEYSYLMADIGNLKYVQSQQDRKICEVLNEFVFTEMGNGGIDGFCLFADYFDYIDYDQYSGNCSFFGKKQYELYPNN